MNARVLVAYATVHGATREIAEAVAATLREQGLTVDLQQLREVRSLEGYGAVVLGAPQYMFRWHKDAPAFLRRFQKQFGAGLPLAVFTGGPFGDTKESGWQDVRRILDKELAAFDWLKPAAVEVFGGRFDPAHLRFPYSLIPALKHMPPSDLRDWEAIRAWASGLAGKFWPQEAQAGA